MTGRVLPLVPRVDAAGRPAGEPLPALCRRYIDIRLSSARASTRANHRTTLAMVERDLDPHPNPAEIALWLARLTGHLAATTVYAHYATLCAVYSHAERLRLSDGNPAAAVGWPRPVTAPRDSLVLASDPAKLLTAPGLLERERAFLATLFYAGLRVGEGIALTARDIDRRAEPWNIFVTWQRSVPNRWEKGPTKTTHRRHVPVCPTLRGLLEPLIGRPVEVRAGRGGGERLVVPFLFPFRTHDLYGRRSRMRAALRAMDPEACGKGDAYHVERHTFATGLAERGASDVDIQAATGHLHRYYVERYTQRMRGRPVRADLINGAPSVNFSAPSTSKDEKPTGHAPNTNPTRPPR